MEKYAETIKRVSGTFGPTPTYSGEALEKIVHTMEAEIPLSGKILSSSLTCWFTLVAKRLVPTAQLVARFRLKQRL